MALKFFFIYIGVFLALSVTLGVAVNRLATGFASAGKRPYLYGVLSSSVASGTAYASTFVSNHLFTVFWVLAVIYLLFGILHVIFVHKKYFLPGKQDRTRIILGELMFGLSIILFSIVVFSALQYFTRNESFLFYPMLTSTLTFFIPFLFLQTFEAAYAIPPAKFKTWQYPLHQRIDIPDKKPGEKQLDIGFRIAKKTTDVKKTYFRALAPEGMPLGELYYHFINDYNDTYSETTIEYVSAEFEPEEWWFRRKPKWYQLQKILDPDISVRENGIRENTIVICERLRKLPESLIR